MSVSCCFWGKIHMVNYTLARHSKSREYYLAGWRPVIPNLPDTVLYPLPLPQHIWPPSRALISLPGSALGTLGAKPRDSHVLGTKLYSQAWVSFSDWCLISWFPTHSFFVLSVCTLRPHLERPSAVHPQPCFTSKSKLSVRALEVSAEVRLQAPRQCGDIHFTAHFQGRALLADRGCQSNVPRT